MRCLDLLRASPPPRPSAAKRKKKWKGNFWFCFAVSVSEKSNLILTFLFALFSTLTATEAHSYPRFVVVITSANHTQPPTHSQLAFARAGCFGVVCVRLMASMECGGNSKEFGDYDLELELTSKIMSFKSKSFLLADKSCLIVKIVFRKLSRTGFSINLLTEKITSFEA